MTCAPGEVLALVGPSGSGKTTILRSVAGLTRPGAGRMSRWASEVWLDRARGIDVPPHRRRVGFVFQNYALFPHMTALGNVAAALGDKPDAKERARDLLDLVHLGGLEERRPAELSGGQQQRVAIARALARDPQVLLLDEPFSAVDKVTRQSLYAQLREVRGRFAMPTVFVTHDFDEAARIADRMCLLDKGAILQQGTPREVLASPASVRAARLVDLRNLFDARVLRIAEGRMVLDWNGRELEAVCEPDFRPGERVAWAIPATRVLLSRADLSAPAITSNVFPAIIRELVQLSESIAVVVALDGPDAPDPLDDPARALCQADRAWPGSAVSVALMPEGIHVMPAET